MPIDRKKVIEEAAKKGIDMSWMERAPRGDVSGAEINRPSLSPAADRLMASVREQQARTPVFQPFAPGTPTQARRQADEQARQFETSHEEAVRQFGLTHEEGVRQFDESHTLREQEQQNLQAYRNAQLELQRATDAAKTAAEAAGIGTYDWYDDLAVSQKQLVGPNIAGEVIHDFVRQAVADGASWSEIKDHLLSYQNKQQLALYYVTDEDILKFAADALERSMNEIVQGLTHMTDPSEKIGGGREATARADLWREVERARKDVERLSPQEKKEEAPDPLAAYLQGIR